MFSLIRPIPIRLITKIPKNTSFSLTKRFVHSSNQQPTITSKMLNYIDTPEYFVVASCCTFVSILSSSMDIYNKVVSSHHDNLIFIISKGIFIGFLFPISFPYITLKVLYKKCVNEKK